MMQPGAALTAKARTRRLADGRSAKPVLVRNGPRMLGRFVAWPLAPWLTLLVAALVLLAKCVPAPLGVPVADDFDYLHRSMFASHHSWLGGGGANVYWRPVGRQLYFALTSWFVVHQPGVVALVHGLTLLATAALLLKALLPRLQWPAAVFAATFVLLLDGTRMLIAWPSNFMDLGAILFAVVALHEALRERTLTMAIAMLLALLSKEIAVVAVVLIPFAPGIVGRRRQALGAGVVLVVWGIAYTFVERQDRLIPSFAPGATGDAAERVLSGCTWALMSGLHSAFSLSTHASPFQAVATPILALLAAAVTLTAWRRADLRDRMKTVGPWVLWGVLWFVFSSLALAPLYPAWTPYRAVFGAIGLGIGLASLAGAVSPTLLASIAALRVALFIVSPGPPARIEPTPPDHGAYLDFPRLVRLERIVVETRDKLLLTHHALPHGAIVGIQGYPLLSTFAFAGPKALHVWYADTTLQWAFVGEQGTRAAASYAAILEYEPDGSSQIASVAPIATALEDSGLVLMSQGQWGRALALLDAADSAQPDRLAHVFLGALFGRRAVCLLSLGRVMEAETEAHRGAALWSYNPDARITLASILFDRGDARGAEAEVDTMLIYNPRDRDALQIRDRIGSSSRGS